jgi:cell division protein FtsI/penicillin-binding protein 2
MKKSKIFLLIAIIFMLIVFYVVYDMSTKTEFRKFGDETQENKSVKDSVERNDPMEVEIRR